MKKLALILLALATIAFSFWLEPCDDSSGHSCKHHVEVTP